MLIAAIDPGLACTGYALFNDREPIHVGYLSTTPAYGIMDRCKQLTTNLETVLYQVGAALEVRPRYHFIYEQFFGGRFPAQNYQRGYLDHAMHQALIDKWGVPVDKDCNSWWEAGPNLHRQWFRLDGKSKAMTDEDGNKLTGESLTLAQIEFLERYNGIKLQSIPGIEQQRPKDYEHITDALALGLALYHAITINTNKVLSNITPVQIKLALKLQSDYPTLATLT